MTSRGHRHDLDIGLGLGTLWADLRVRHQRVLPRLLLGEVATDPRLP